HGGRMAASAALRNEKGSRSCLFRGQGGDTLGNGRRRALLSVTLTEFFDASGRIDDLLFARVKRVARRTNFDVQRLVDRRARLEGDAAAAGHVDFAVFGMNIGFHCVPLAWA